MEKKFSIFRKNISEAFGKVSPSCRSLCVYVETKQGWAVDWGTAFDLKGGGTYRLSCPVWQKKRMGVKIKRMEPLLIPSLDDCYLSI